MQDLKSQAFKSVNKIVMIKEIWKKYHISTISQIKVVCAAATMNDLSPMFHLYIPTQNQNVRLYIHRLY